MSPKQLQVFNCFKRHLLVSGPKMSGKTLGGVCNKIVRHAFDTRPARVGIFSKTIKSAKEGGIWTDLTEIILPQWFEAGITRYLTPPKQDGQTRSLFCEIENRYGGGTRIYLNSLDYDDDVERILFQRRFSLLAFSELQNFGKRKVFNTAVSALRMPGLPYEQHMILSDCNPSDEGEDSWIYKLWWDERLATEYPEHIVTEEQKKDIDRFRNDLGVIEIMIEDNPFLSDDQRRQLYQLYGSDPDTAARYLRGQWVRATSEGFFSKIFREEIHVLGNVSKPNRDEWEVIVPPDNCTTIYTGWDVGDRNSAVLFLIKESDGDGKNYWSIIDEIVVDNESVLLEDLVALAVRKMDSWEAVIGHPVQWLHYSDSSSFNYTIAAKSTEQIQIQRYSRNRIRLIGSDAKYVGGSMDAVELTRRLLFENRLFVSAHCFETKIMFKSLKQSATKSPSGLVRVARTAPGVHLFDSYRYCVLAVEPQSVARSMPRSNKIRPRIVALA